MHGATIKIKLVQQFVNTQMVKRFLAFTEA
jgi:CHASE1-domain containing sensor protein